MTKSPRPYLIRILRALTRIESYRPRTKEEFLRHEMLQDAMLMQLHEIGENLAQLRRLNEEAFREAPDSWHQVIALRHIISHGYETVKPDQIWTYISEELVEFRESIEATLEADDTT